MKREKIMNKRGLIGTFDTISILLIATLIILLFICLEEALIKNKIIKSSFWVENKKIICEVK